MSIATRLKSLRQEYGLSQNDLARETGLSKKSIINYENGYRQPNSKAMATLEQFFNVSGSYLRGEDDSISDLSKDERDLIQQYRALDHIGQEITKLTIKRELERLENPN